MIAARGRDTALARAAALAMAHLMGQPEGTQREAAAPGAENEPSFAYQESVGAATQALDRFADMIPEKRLDDGYHLTLEARANMTLETLKQISPFALNVDGYTVEDKLIRELKLVR